MISRPVVGMKLKLLPSFTFEKHPTNGNRPAQLPKYPCEIVYVNEKHLYFRVRFTIGGLHYYECFKYIPDNMLLHKEVKERRWSQGSWGY